MNILLTSIPRWWNSLRLHTQIALLSGVLVAGTVITLTFYSSQKQTQEFRDNIDSDIQALSEHLSLSTPYSILRNDYAAIEDLLLKLAHFSHITQIQITDPGGHNLGKVIRTVESATTVVYPNSTLTPPATLSLYKVQTGPDAYAMWNPIISANHLGWVRIDYDTREINGIQTQTWAENMATSVLFIALYIIALLAILRPPMNELKRAAVFASNLDKEKGKSLHARYTFRELEEMVSALNRTSIELKEQDSAILSSNTRLKNIALELRQAKEQLERRVEERTQQLSWQASHDPLTSLYNRHAFEHNLLRLLESCKRNPESSHVLFYLDLDQFKIVNDTSGHIAGDELLRQISYLLVHSLRDTDIVTRLGGDEFGILLENCSLEQSTHIADNLLKEIHNIRFAWRDKTFTIGASIGIVAITPDAGRPDEILSAADIACYTAKDRGRNRYHIYQENDLELAERSGQMEWVTNIHNALDNNLFCLYRQSIRPIHNSKLPMHYEILVRMRDKKKSIILPNSFIPAAERYGLMNQIDRWVIQAMFTNFRNLAEEAGDRSIYSINLSGASLGDEHICDYIQDAIHSFHVPPERLCFEVTETSAIRNLKSATDLIHQLKGLGCRFSLDDFGSGLSSFNYLKNLDVDYLKIDGSFVHEVLTDPTANIIVEAINDIGHSIGLTTIAEYVENKGIYDAVKGMGIDFAQGYAIDRPQLLSLTAPGECPVLVP